MPRSGSGTYTLPAPYPSGFQTSTVISATTMNTVLTDVQTALTASTAADGQTPITGNWNFAGKNLTNVGTLGASNIAATDLATSNGVTVGNALVVTKGGATITAGGVTVSAGGLIVAGGGTVSGGLTADVLSVGSATVTWTDGNGAPVAAATRGSLYSRRDGGVGTTLYVSQGGGTWNAVAGV
jgi:hypothetical protein